MLKVVISTQRRALFVAPRSALDKALSCFVIFYKIASFPFICYLNYPPSKNDFCDPRTLWSVCCGVPIFDQQRRIENRAANRMNNP